MAHQMKNFLARSYTAIRNSIPPLRFHFHQLNARVVFVGDRGFNPREIGDPKWRGDREWQWQW